MNSIAKGLILAITLLFIGLLTMRQSSKIETTYNSLEMRKLPCGRILQRSVQENNGTWTRKVVLMSADGKTLNSKTKDIHPDTCHKIKSGIFIPGLWENDGALGCISEY